MIVYRIEHKDTENGMWYNKDGSYNGLIHELSNAQAKDFPMDYDEKYSLKNLISGVKDFNQLLEWFSRRDIEELMERGYQIYKFIAKEYEVEDTQVLFRKYPNMQRELISLAGVKNE